MTDSELHSPSLFKLTVRMPGRVPAGSFFGGSIFIEQAAPNGARPNSPAGVTGYGPSRWPGHGTSWPSAAPPGAHNSHLKKGPFKSLARGVDTHGPEFTAGGRVRGGGRSCWH